MIAVSTSMPISKRVRRKCSPRATSRAGPIRIRGEAIRVEHWVVAERQGQTAALNMLGPAREIYAVPFFWSQHYDVPINYVGHAERWDDLSSKGISQARTASCASTARDAPSRSPRSFGISKASKPRSVLSEKPRKRIPDRESGAVLRESLGLGDIANGSSIVRRRVPLANSAMRRRLDLNRQQSDECK